jgi:hypothetical protein
MAPGRKTGGRVRGISKNKPKPIILEPTPENRALQLLAESAPEVRTPKAVMLGAMRHFEDLALGLIDQAKLKLATDPEAATALGIQGQKFMIAAVQCADRVAPYIHARLLAIESRGDMTADKAPYVVRVPSVMADSTAWQAAVGAAVIDMEPAQIATGGRTEALSHPAMPQPVTPEPPPPPAPVALVADQKTGRITIMPPGPKVVQPAGTDEWLQKVTAERRKVAG